MMFIACLGSIVLLETIPTTKPVHFPEDDHCFQVLDHQVNLILCATVEFWSLCCRARLPLNSLKN